MNSEDVNQVFIVRFPCTNLRDGSLVSLLCVSDPLGESVIMKCKLRNQTNRNCIPALSFSLLACLSFLAFSCWSFYPENKV